MFQDLTKQKHENDCSNVVVLFDQSSALQTIFKEFTVEW